MVRLGIGLYGVSANYRDKLVNVSTLKSSLIQVKNIKKGETVGYGRKWQVNNDMKLGIVPIGYADGINRRLGNGRGRFLIGGKPVPVVGNICMDVCMVDISNVNATPGDEVIIFGKENPIEDMAKILDTIPYEIFTGISERVKRVYFQE